MSDATDRASLYSRLSDVIGVDHAGVLMSYLSGDEPATKADLTHLRLDLEGRLDGVEHRFNAVEARFDAVDRRMERFEDKLDGFHHALLIQGRTYAISTAGSIIGVVGVVVAITRLG